MGCSGDEVMPFCQPSTIQVSPGTFTIVRGHSATFQARMTPDCHGNPSKQQFTWKVSRETVATIESTTDTTVVLAGRALGVIDLIATAVTDTTVKGAAVVVVEGGTPAPVP